MPTGEEAVEGGEGWPELLEGEFLGWSVLAWRRYFKSRAWSYYF